VLPAEFHSVDDFLNFFTQSQEVQGAEGRGREGAEEGGGGGGRGLVELQGLLAPLMLRRVKQDVERTLLPKIEINLYLALSSMQQALYASLLKKDLGLISGTEGDKSRLLNMVPILMRTLFIALI
jgi:SWI/SNF-related matrix-associated actin-dependent regulator of chromatin subfamily A member 5